MSDQPKRFDPIIDDDGLPAMDQFREGDYVLFSDYAQLKAEVDKLTFDPMSYLDDQGEWMPRQTHLAAVERLKAEVERLEGLVKYWQIEAETDNAHWVRHAETNERLRKAGDAMAEHITPDEDWREQTAYGDLFNHEYKLVQAWYAAKNGMPTK